MSSFKAVRSGVISSASRLLCAVFVLACSVAVLPVLAQTEPDGLARPRTAIVPDAVTLLSPAQVHVTGVLGERYASSWKNWLLTINENELLDGYRHRPGKQAWVGEHVGKWLHAAALTCVVTGDRALLAKMDRIAAELIKTQEADGYLGTYVLGNRFGIYKDADWDVWSHKYNLIGLLAYYQYTGNKAALESCKHMGGLLLATFSPEKKSLLDAGAHMGLAPASIIEPMVLLYRASGDNRYLDFAKHALTTLDSPQGAHLFLPAGGSRRERDAQQEILRDDLVPGRHVRVVPHYG